MTDDDGQEASDDGRKKPPRDHGETIRHRSAKKPRRLFGLLAVGGAMLAVLAFWLRRGDADEEGSGDDDDDDARSLP